MITELEQRAINIAQYIIATGNTVRKAAEIFELSKSSVYTDITNKLHKIDYVLWEKCRGVLQENKKQRSNRGGESTRMKYIQLK